MARMLKAQNKSSRCWKNADLELARELVAGLDYSRTIRSKEELEAYANYLSSFLARVMSASVPLRRASNYANPWWNPQVAGAVREARKAQRRWLQSRDLHDKQEAVRLSATRSKVVKEAKQASFRQFIDEEAQEDGL